jgi:sec-independent protein translocase protein TatA
VAGRHPTRPAGPNYLSSTNRSNLAIEADEGDGTVHFGLPAEIFGMDGIIVLIVVVLVLFGSTQIPKLARSLGSAQKEFKKGLDEGGQPDDPKAAATTVVVTPPAQPVQPAPHAPAAGDPGTGTP